MIPIDGRFAGSAFENAWLASMTSLPLYSNGSASAKTKNGAPLPTRFATVSVCVPVPAATSSEKFVVRNVSVIFVAVIALTVPTSATPTIWLCGRPPVFGKPAKPVKPDTFRVSVPPATDRT